MAWQSSGINPAVTSPASDISKITNDLAQLRGVIGGTPDAAIPSVWATLANLIAQSANSATTGGTSTAYTLAPATTIAAYAAGQTFWVTFHTASGATPTLQISGLTSPPNLVRQLGDGTFANVGAGDIPANHRSRVTLISASQALVEDMPPPSVGGAQGQCRLTLSGGNLLLSPFGGNLLTVNGVNCTVPDAGITLAATSLTPGTLYYIYALAASGAVSSLEASATGWAVSTASGNKGVPQKSADATRTLVGMARPVTGPAWVDTAAQRFVVSFWNRRERECSANFTAGRTTASASWVELNTEIRNEFLTWADESVRTVGTGSHSMAGAGSRASLAVGYDGTTAELGGCSSFLVAAANNGYEAPTAVQATRNNLSEGYHYATLLGSTSGGVTMTCTGGASGVAASAQPTKLSTMLRC